MTFTYINMGIKSQGTTVEQKPTRSSRLVRGYSFFCYCYCYSSSYSYSNVYSYDYSYSNGYTKAIATATVTVTLTLAVSVTVTVVTANDTETIILYCIIIALLNNVFKYTKKINQIPITYIRFLTYEMRMTIFLRTKIKKKYLFFFLLIFYMTLTLYHPIKAYLRLCPNSPTH